MVVKTRKIGRERVTVLHLQRVKRAGEGQKNIRNGRNESKTSTRRSKMQERYCEEKEEQKVLMEDKQIF